MSFSKSQRFTNAPVGCGADAVYSFKSKIKPIGGVIPKDDRFKSMSDISDTESVASDKSAQLFRTPKSIKKNILNSAKKPLPSAKSCGNILCFKTSHSFVDEIVKAKEVEIKNKDATIKDYEQQIKEINGEIGEFKNEIAKLQDELAAKKSTIKSPDKKINELKENLSLVKSHHALALEANESIRLEYKMEIDSLKAKHDEDMQAIVKHYNSEIEEIKNGHKSNTENLSEEFTDKIKYLEEDYIGQIKMLEETSIEKIKICEIQYEERLQELKTYTDSVLHQEKQKWEEEMKKCQDLTEKEILIYELQVQDLKLQLDLACGNVKDLSNSITTLQKTIDVKEKQLNEAYSKIQLTEDLSNTQRSEYLKEIEMLNQELRNIKHEKNKFSLTLETTRQTMNALSTRLRSSDEDVERLKDELELTRNELDDLKMEYNQLLVSIIGSKTALDESHKNILEKNSDLSNNLVMVENDFVEQIENIKTHVYNEISNLKSYTLALINELEEKNIQEHQKYVEVKEKCDEAYNVISECKSIMFNAECQLEMKDQEINELETENNRLTGTLAAVEQERNELTTLIEEFNSLLNRNNEKIGRYIDTIDENESNIKDLNNQVKKLSQLLEVTEYIMKEKENENNSLQEELRKSYQFKDQLTNQFNEITSQLDEYETQNNDLVMKHAYEKNILQDEIKKLISEIKFKEESIKELQHKTSESSDEYENHLKTCNTRVLEAENAKLEAAFEELSNKYANLIGHHNNKQKIKHLSDLKTQNANLKEENEKLRIVQQKQAEQIEKLKKETESKTISPVRKSFLSVHTPRKGKENSPMGKSPKPNSASPLVERVPTPLKDLNI